jgi:4-amino-4-deoxy-L-arabinose transferase-like glycosyltransferase
VRRPVITLLLLSAVMFLTGLGRPAVTDADEAYYAEASREMVESGDWLTPHFNYRDRFEKPVLYYWLTAATFWVTGPTEWAARLWSALSGIGLTLITWSIARRRHAVADSGGAAWLAGAIVATSFGYFAEGRMALPDLPLTFCITLAIWSATRASLDGAAAAPRMRWWVIAGAGAGLGFLMKGPVALVVPALVLLPIWWREWPRVSGLRGGVTIAALTCAAIGLPWYVAMWAEHGTAYLNSFFIGDNLERFATGRFNERRIPLFYVAVLIGGLLPWSAYLATLPLGSISRLRRGTRTLSDEEWRLVIWCLMPLIFFTVSVGQQPRYILPVLPPLAILLAGALVRRTAAAAAAGAPRDLRTATWITAGFIMAVAVLLARAQPILTVAYPLLTWMAVCVIAAAAIGMGWTAVSRSWQRLPAVLVAAAAALLLAVQFGALAKRRPEPVEQMAALVNANRLAGEPVGQYNAFVRNLVFYARFRQVELFDDRLAIDFMTAAERVLLVIGTEDLDRLQAASGVTMRTLASVRYLNTANLKFGTLLRPDPQQHLKTILLVTNR